MSKLLFGFATAMAFVFVGAAVPLFTEFSGLALIFAACYIADRADPNVNMLSKQKMWRYVLLLLAVVVSVIDLLRVVEILNP